MVSLTHSSPHLAAGRTGAQPVPVLLASAVSMVGARSAHARARPATVAISSLASFGPDRHGPALTCRSDAATSPDCVLWADARARGWRYGTGKGGASFRAGPWFATPLMPPNARVAPAGAGPVQSDNTGAAFRRSSGGLARRLWSPTRTIEIGNSAMATLLICGKVFDGVSDTLLDRTEILIEGRTISEMAVSVTRMSLAEVVDLTEYTVMPQMIVPGLIPRRDDWRELFLLVQSGVAAARVLRAATSASATLTGQPDLGSVAPGKVASLIGVGGNPLEDISVVRRPEFIMAEGRILRRPSRRPVIPTHQHDQPATSRRPELNARDGRMATDLRAST